MSERGADFLVSWVEQHITPSDYPPEVDKAEAQIKADQCLVDAAISGIAPSEIEAEVGPLAGYMHVMMSAPTERGLVQVAFEDDPERNAGREQPSLT